MLKWIATAVIGALSVAAIVPPLTGALTPANEASKLVEAAGRTNNQAGDLGASFAEVVPLTDEQGNPATPEPQQAPLDPKYQEYASDSEHAISDAMTFLNQLRHESGPVTRTQYVNAVTQLKSAWQPRYDKAAADYKVFAYRINHAEKMAQQYFEIQADLTSHIANPEHRRQSEEQDQRELAVFRQWRDQAHETLSQARAIKQDLDDMNIVIAKLELSANFSALYQDFQQLPASMVSLHSEIGQFRRESQRISQTFGPSPFLTEQTAIR